MSMNCRTIKTRSSQVVRGILLGAVLCVAGRTSGADAALFTLPLETAKFKPGPGAELAMAQCMVCHSADYVSTQPRLSGAAWAGIVQKMREKYGAPVPSEQTNRIVEYLVQTYGKPAKPAP